MRTKVNIFMKKIILKNDYLELMIWKRKHIPVKNIKNNDLLSEMDESLLILYELHTR